MPLEASGYPRIGTDRTALVGARSMGRDYASLGEEAPRARRPTSDVSGDSAEAGVARPRYGRVSKF